MNAPDQLKILLEQLINGITVGSFYALVALGYSMVYGVLSMVNFAHGDIFMVGAYFGYFTITRLTAAGVTQGSPALAVTLALLAGMGGAAITGMLVERLAYRPLRRASRLASLIAAIGASLFLQEFVRLLPNIGTAIISVRIGNTYLFPEGLRIAIISIVKDFGGAMVKTYPGVLDVSGITLGGVTISYSRILIVGLSLFTMAALYLLVRYT